MKGDQTAELESPGRGAEGAEGEDAFSCFSFASRGRKEF